jgi:hypothetical protein
MRLPDGPSIPTLYLCSLWPVLSGLGTAPSAPCSCCALMFDGAVGLFAVWADLKPLHVFSGVVRSTLAPRYVARSSRASRITFSFTSANTLACICTAVRLRLKLKDWPSCASTICSIT